jgi:hypothetical protein
MLAGVDPKAADRRNSGQGERKMRELLQDVYDYQNLVGRRRLRLELGERGARRLAALERKLAQDPETRSRRTTTRHYGCLPAWVRVEGFDERAYVIDLAAGGLALAPPPPGLVPGVHTVVTVRDPETDRDYRLPARVVWSSSRRVGLVFTGLPVELRRQPGASAAA